MSGRWLDRVVPIAPGHSVTVCFAHVRAEDSLETAGGNQYEKMNIGRDLESNKKSLSTHCFLRHRQHKRDARSTAEIAFDRDPTLMSFGDRLANRQT
jgi:hypothetical protein